ncbi:hypothetical protein AGMMS49521_1320 [Campylobacterota bacterium]|nr:hypothetical protein AGMMS49521_1320 [Campylobacterota bacterium]
MVLVSLIGDFDSSLLPTFFEYKEQITLHLLLSSSSRRSEKERTRITRGLNALRSKYRLKCTLQEMSVDTGSMKSIIALSNMIKQLSPPNQLFVNLSDGEVNMAILLSREIIDYGANILIYDRFANDMSLITVEGMSRLALKHNMSIADHIISKGYDLVEAKSKTEMEYRKPFVQVISDNFAQFQKYRRRVMEEKKIDEERYEPVVGALAKMGVATSSGRPINMNFILGELFEEQIYHIVNDLGFDDVMSGVKVRYETINGVTIQNEFDVLMIKNNHLYIIECKFRDRVDGENLIYKYDALLEQMDNDGKVMIVNVASTESKEALKRGKRIHRNFEKGALSRAQLNNILIYYEPTLDIAKLTVMMKTFFEL